MRSTSLFLKNGARRVGKANGSGLRPDDRLRVPTLGLSRWARREDRAFTHPTLLVKEDAGGTPALRQSLKIAMSLVGSGPDKVWRNA